MYGGRFKSLLSLRVFNFSLSRGSRDSGQGEQGTVVRDIRNYI